MKRAPISPRPARSVLKRKEDEQRSTSSPKSILKTEQDHAYDEGISSDESNSDHEAADSEVRFKDARSSSDEDKRSARLGDIAASSRFSAKNASDDNTTDESSGGREIQNIIGSDREKHKDR